MLVWAEGFDWLPGSTGDVATSDLGVKYDGVNLSSAVKVGVGRGTAGKSLRMDASPARIVKFIDSNSEFVTGFAFRFNSGVSVGRIFSLNDDPTGQQCRIEINADDELELYRGAAVQLLGTSTTVLASGTWYYVELYYKVDSSDGAFEMRIDGDTEVSGAGVNTRGVATDVMDLIVLADDCNRNVEFDDWYLQTGSTFLGDSVVRDIFPTSDGDDSEWSPDSGTDHFDRIDETPFDGDTSYLDSDTVSERDLFNFPSLSIGGQIHGVQLNAIARKTTGTSFTLKQVVKSDASFGGGDSNQAVTSTTYDHFHKVVEDDPDTSAAWQPAALNNAQWGIEHG
jgi:hypothetical protein